MSMVRQLSEVPKAWTVLSMIEWSRDYLTERGFDEARLHAELMLASVLHTNRLQLYLQFDRPLVAQELSAYRELFKRRLVHEPLQYILGEAVFMGITLGVGPGVLVPRPETELLVERALLRIRGLGRSPARVLDVGTGSGNIALALAHYAPGASVTGVDSSEAAIVRSRDNASRLNAAGVEFIYGDVFDAGVIREKYDIVVSNPPYVSKEEFETLMPEVRDFEPRGALTDEQDGFGFLGKLAPRMKELLVPNGVFLCEIGFGQETGAWEIFEGAGFVNLEIHPDYAGIPRVVEGEVT
jgi:release factor glutamine methyltransferase